MLKRPAARTTVRPDASRRRAQTVAFALAGWMLIIGARLIYLQTSQHEWLSERAFAQQRGTVTTNPVRGLILDRAGRELARSFDLDSFFAAPDEIEDINDVASRLAPVFGCEVSTLAARLQGAKEANRKFVWLARKVAPATSEQIKTLNLGCIHSLKEPERRYPNGSLAAHVLGFVGLDETGLAGAEQFQNIALTGEAGKIFVEGDARRRPFDSAEIEARSGQSVVLTIDQIVQYRTEQALAAEVEQTHAKSGAAIVFDPHTGEILALANVPSFDPNSAGSAAPEARANWALQNIYEPGSTFKIVAYSAAIEEKLARPTDLIDCQMGAITVAGRVIHDHKPFGTLTLNEALAKSSNVAAIKMGLRVGDRRMYDYATRFGFGSRTGVELPGETAGLLRPVARWQPSSIGSIAMGQEIGVTPLQMVAAFGALANDGVRVAPHLVRELRAANGSTLRQTVPEQHRVVSADTARTLRYMLENVTLKGGTAARAQLSGYTAAGKTGTAQKIDPRTKTYSKTKYVASFVGFAPVERPSVVVIVVIDEPVGAHHGGDVAAPVFREITESVLPYLNVPPDSEVKQAPDGELAARKSKAAVTDTPGEAEDGAAAARWPEVEREGDAGGGSSEVVYTVAGERALAMPDLRRRSVRDAARICAQLGLELEAHGQGRAVRQSPAAGTSVEAGQVVSVDFMRSD